MKTPRKNPRNRAAQDTTLINNRAQNKRITKLEGEWAEMSEMLWCCVDGICNLLERVIRLEDAQRLKKAIRGKRK